jgi:hypothetical protein
MKLPAQYRITRNSLEKMTKIDPVAKVRNKAIPMEVYAYQAKDEELVAYATEIKMRATRRIGELMAEYRAAGKLAKGTKGQLAGKKKNTSKGKGKGSSGGVAKTPPEEASLAKQGVTKDLAKQARKAAAMQEEKFEAGVKKSVAVAVPLRVARMMSSRLPERRITKSNKRSGPSGKVILQPRSLLYRARNTA